MVTSVIETQLDGTTRIYELAGPQFLTVAKFWAWLEETGVIDTYTVWEGELA